jgi:hypothetical protein
MEFDARLPAIETVLLISLSIIATAGEPIILASRKLDRRRPLVA